MSATVKDVTFDDIALIELASGRKTDAPAGVLQRLQAKGYLVAGAKPQLTAKGRRRGERLARCEHDLRLMCANAKGGTEVTTDARSTVHISAGQPAKISA
jgi:hypothetical protein